MGRSKRALNNVRGKNLKTYFGKIGTELEKLSKIDNTDVSLEVS